MLGPVKGGGGLGLVVHPRPEVVDPWVKGVLARVLEDHLARNLGVATAAVLVGPLNGQDTPGVVVHPLVLGEGAGSSSVRVERGKSSSSVLGLEEFVSDGPRAGIPTVIVVLTD